MRVWSATSLPSAAVLWQDAAGSWSLTAIAKATFALEQGESPLGPTQEPIRLEDHYGSGGILRGPNDLAPFKVRPDVIIVGSAFSPRPVSSLVARVMIGSVDKAMEVHCSRWLDDQGQIVEGPLFTAMPLGWQNAAGGRDSHNPAGISLDEEDRRGRVTLPHQVPQGTRQLGRGDYVEPIAFSPVPPGWPQRAHLAGGAGPATVGGRWFDSPLPNDVHPAFFNVAPIDQQPDFLPDDPRLVLEHLSPVATRIATTLAPVRVFSFVEGGRAAGRYAMRPDTLWIDTERQLCCVTYRATIPLGDREAGLAASIVSDPPAPLNEPSAIAVIGDEEELEPEQTHSGEHDVAPQDLGRQSTSTHLVSSTEGLPFAAPWDRESPVATPPPAALPFRQRKVSHTRPIDAASLPSATPFEGQAGHQRPPLPMPPPPMAGGGTMTANLSAPLLSPPMGSGAINPPLGPPPVGPPPLGTPSMPSAPPLSPPFGPHAGRNDAQPKTVPPPMPSGPTAAPPLAPPPRQPMRADVGGPVIPAPSPSNPGGGPAPAWTFQPTPEAPKKVLHEARAALDGVAGASNAAADRNELGGARSTGSGRERPRVTSNDVVDLIWYDEALPDRIRRHAPWGDAVRDERRVDDWVTTPEKPEQAQQDKDRRHVMRALARVQPTDATTFNRLLSESVDDEGFVDRPLLVVAGELQLQFDPIETLKASVELASQLGSNEKLKEAIDASKDVAQAQRVSTPVVDNLLGRLRSAFAQANRNLPNDYLETTVQRTMLEERKYQKRKVIGGEHVVAMLSASGPTTAVYLPEHLAAQLPVVQKFKARLVVEPHPQQHPADGDGVALGTLALGRVIGSRGRF